MLETATRRCCCCHRWLLPLKKPVDSRVSRVHPSLSRVARAVSLRMARTRARARVRLVAKFCAVCQRPYKLYASAHSFHMPTCPPRLLHIVRQLYIRIYCMILGACASRRRGETRSTVLDCLHTSIHIKKFACDFRIQSDWHAHTRVRSRSHAPARVCVCVCIRHANYVINDWAARARAPVHIDMWCGCIFIRYGFLFYFSTMLHIIASGRHAGTRITSNDKCNSEQDIRLFFNSSSLFIYSCVVRVLLSLG